MEFWNDVIGIGGMTSWSTKGCVQDFAPLGSLMLLDGLGWNHGLHLNLDIL